VRSVSSVALQLLRSLEEMLLKGATHNLVVRTRSEIALYLLNHKRAHLRTLEERFRITIMVHADATIAGQLSFVIEKGEQVHSIEQARALAMQPANVTPIEDEDEEDELEEDADEAALDAEESGAIAAGEEGIADGEADGEIDQAAQGQGPEQGRGRRRRRRRGRRGGGEGRAPMPDHEAALSTQDDEVADFGASASEDDDAAFGEPHQARNGAAGAETAGEPNGDGERRRRRRGRRGGRRNRRGREGEAPFAAEHEGEPEVTSAVADLDGAPADEPEAAIVHVPITETPSEFHPQPEASSHQEPPAPAQHGPAEHAAHDAPEVTESVPSEPPRRRSTVREPAPTAARDAASEPAEGYVPPPPVEPVVSSPAEAEADDKPRRSGWWSKRALGKG
jgi:ribonuclease E